MSMWKGRLQRPWVCDLPAHSTALPDSRQLRTGPLAYRLPHIPILVARVVCGLRWQLAEAVEQRPRALGFLRLDPELGWARHLVVSAQPTDAEHILHTVR